MLDRDRKLKWTWVGPKEWRPERWKYSPLLSIEENHRIRSILRESKKSDPKIAPADITWLCQTIQKVADCEPDDYSFPAYLALVHQGEEKSYATRYKETLLIENTVTLKGPLLGAQLLDHWTSDQPHDAVALIRPYIRIGSPADPNSLLCLRKSTLSMRVDYVQVLRTPIDEHLILPDKSFPRKNRWKLRGLDKFLFLANRLEGDTTVLMDAVEGVFCPNGSRIMIDLFTDRHEFQGELTLTAGLVAARYTTKGHDGEPHTPRTIT